MSTKWLVICDAQKACIYDISKGEKHSLLKTLLHPAGRLKDSELMSDDQGHYGAHHGVGQGAFVPHTDPHETELVHFSQEIVKFLTGEYGKQSFNELVVCAEPHFHGIVEKSLSEHLKKIKIHHIEKDYIPLPEHELEKMVEKIQKEDMG